MNYNTRVENYYSSDEEEESPQFYPHPNRQNRARRNSPRQYYSDEEEDLSRAMYELNMHGPPYRAPNRIYDPSHDFNHYARYPTRQQWGHPISPRRHSPEPHRSASSRSYMRPARPSRRQYQEVFLSHDEESEPSEHEEPYFHDVSPSKGYLSRQNSISSTGSNRMRPKRRLNSFSVPPPPPPPSSMSSPRYFYPPQPTYTNRVARSVPNSPHISDETSESEQDEFYPPPRRFSLSNNGPIPPPHPPRMNRSFSFSGAPPPPPPPPPMPPIVLHPPMPHPMVDTAHPLSRRNSLYNTNDFFVDQMMNQNDGSNVPTTSDPPIHPWLAMVNNGFPHSPGNPNLFNPAMMGIPPVLNPMMPPPPMWNMMNLTQDPLWINNEPPFVNPNELNETGKQSPSEPAEQRNMEEPPPSQPPVEMMMPPPPPPPPPMLRRGLSMLGGLFTNKRQPDFYSNEEFQFNQAKKEAKLAKEYAKLGTFYCWRKLDGTDAHFESFSIPNQKIIKRKLAKNAPSQIMLGKEKKLPGEIMVDLQQNRGCYLGKINGEQFLVQLEIKEETYHPSHHFVFATEGHV